MKFQFTNAENTQVQGTLDEGETFGYHTGPVMFSIGMAPGNRDFDELFPNAKTVADPADVNSTILPDSMFAALQRQLAVELGEPAHPIEEYVAPPPAPFSVAKIDVLRQLSDDEFAKLDAAVKQQSAKTQAIYNTAVNFVSDSPEYGQLMQIAVGLFGEERAKALLQPSSQG